MSRLRLSVALTVTVYAAALYGCSGGGEVPAPVGVNDLESQLAAAEQRALDAEGQMAELQRELDEQTKLDELKVSDLESQLAAAEQRALDAEGQVAELQRELDDLKDQIAQADDDPTPPPVSEMVLLAELLPDPTHEFRVLSATRRTGGGTVSVVDTDIVHSIASDGNGGFVVTYTTPEQGPRVVEFDAATFDPDNEGRTRYESESFDGFGRWLWSHTGAFNDGPSNAGSSQFDYFDVSVFSTAGSGGAYRDYLVYGVETETAPKVGSANYTGRMFAEMYVEDDPVAATSLHRIRGNLTLEADFGAGTVGGSIQSMQIRLPGADGFQNDPMTISIGASPVKDGGFAGSWSEDGAGGLAGEVEARFFGPTANEVGGTMSGTDPGKGLVLIGYIGGKK